MAKLNLAANTCLCEWPILMRFCRLIHNGMCEGQGGHPMLFWDVATGLGGVVGKKGAGDGGSYKSIYIYLQGGLNPNTRAHKINKHKSTNENTDSTYRNSSQ